MVSVLSNIFVTVTKAYEVPEEKHASERTHRKPLYTWLISVELRKPHILRPGCHTYQPVHYTATKSDNAENYILNTVPCKGVIGAIMIAKDSENDVQAIHKMLAEGLELKNLSIKPDLESSEEPDLWIQKALTVLQDRNITNYFDVKEFVDFAHQYADKRAADRAADVIAYPPLFNDPKVDLQGHASWVHQPESAKANDRAKS